MNSRFTFCTILLGTLFSSSIVYGQSVIDATWKQIATGVFEKTEGDVTTRMAYGPEGAAYDRGVLTAQIRTLENLSANGFASSAEEAKLAQLKEAVARIPLVPKSGDAAPKGNVVPFATNFGDICTRFDYGLDSHMVVGAVGASVIARSGGNTDGFGPPPAFNSILVYARATVTPSGVSPITVTKSTSALSDVVAVANWQLGGTSVAVIQSNWCTGNSYAYVQVDAPFFCSPNPKFISQTKTYATCVGSL